MKVVYDSKTKTYSARITIGEKEPLSPDDMRKAISKSIGGVLGRWRKEKLKQEIDILFWFEEGWL